MSQKKMRILKKMAKFAHQSRPTLSEDKVFEITKRVYKGLTSKQKAEIKGLEVK